MKQISIVFLILLISCTKEEIPVFFDNIAAQTFETGLRIDGHEYDGLLIENCTFKNKPLNLGNVQNVIIRNCVLKVLMKMELKLVSLETLQILWLRVAPSKTLDTMALTVMNAHLIAQLKIVILKMLRFQKLGRLWGSRIMGFIGRAKM
jgi:hypothetical protein